MAERHIIGTLLNSPMLFHAIMPDGRPLSETIVASDFINPANQSVYGAMYEWLLEADASGEALEQITGHDLRHAMPEDWQQRFATEIQVEVVQFAGDDPQRMASLLNDSVGQIIARRERLEYDSMKMNLARDASDSSQVSGEQRLLSTIQALTQMRPSALRSPKTIR